ASFWSIRYAMSQTPWDLGQPYSDLTARLERDPGLGAGSPGRALVPGCGSGHDAGALADHGWVVTGLDFAPSAEPLFDGKVQGRGEFVLGDLFAYRPEEPFDLVFDHTCFCAISPARRMEFGLAAAGWVKPGGRFVSVVFPMGKPIEHGGPPYAMATDDLALALGSNFELVTDDDADCSGRRWETRWAVFARLDSPTSAVEPL
ncbi:MAG: methyltransferase domain-containing protein, partial [Acidimicrobiia bacterium]|nr:methyltransferase domain-containing protein [Acidimicrobiia bacterium]